MTLVTFITFFYLEIKFLGHPFISEGVFTAFSDMKQ